MNAAAFALQCAWQCVQFWTPLSVTVLLLWLIYRPDRFHPYIDDAVLAALDLTHGNATARNLRYDLSLGLGFRNSHSRLSILYLDVGATAFYNDTKLGTAVNSLPNFRQPPKNTTVWHPAFQGTLDGFSGKAAAELERERASRVVHVRVRVDLTLMYKVWFVENVVFYVYDCWLWFSLPHKDAPALFHGDGIRCWRV
ncbi:unnamed protein product [Urochloa decumbens]|uniref:Late embryogenesis abundant protein LEA-2 subgroup domain-containing protein n=1 Tax=Urochloa decumbens TaxID=240449 RepID=A0ABC9ANY6_9POAL